MPTIQYRRVQNRSPRPSNGSGVVGLVLFILILAGIGTLVPRSKRTPHFSQPSTQFDQPQIPSGPPPGYTIKGNISVDTGAKLYHLPGMRDYEITEIDESRGERWFRSEQEAIAAGWRKAGPSSNRSRARYYPRS